MTLKSNMENDIGAELKKIEEGKARFRDSKLGRAIKGFIGVPTNNNNPFFILTFLFCGLLLIQGAIMIWEYKAIYNEAQRCHFENLGWECKTGLGCYPKVNTSFNLMNNSTFKTEGTATTTTIREGRPNDCSSFSECENKGYHNCDIEINCLAMGQAQR